jgi:4'-phosphopantetheinyl transferase
MVSEEERRRSTSFVRPADRLRFLARRAALRSIIARYVGGDPLALPFDAGRLGKPQLRASGIHFNLSSSGQVALVVVGRHELGVDVELARPLDDVLALAATCCSPEECALLARAAEAERMPLFLRLWTRKEAVTKAAGTGLSTDPATVDVRGDIVPCGVTAEGAPRRWIVRDLPMGSGYHGAMATPGEIELVVTKTYGWPGEC